MEESRPRTDDVTVIVTRLDSCYWHAEISPHNLSDTGNTPGEALGNALRCHAKALGLPEVTLPVLFDQSCRASIQMSEPCGTIIKALTPGIPWDRWKANPNHQLRALFGNPGCETVRIVSPEPCHPSA